MATGRIKIARLQQIAEGGMAVLFLAAQSDGSQLVIRELHPKLRWRLRSHYRFLRGARIRDLVSPHPNIIFSVEYGYAGLVPYEVIEYVPGVSLSTLIGKKDDIQRKNALEVLRQASCAISHIHDKGFIHLDIKAENFVIDAKPDGTIIVKLTDFDLARKSAASHDARRSGTASYMAPELLRQGSVGVEADVFAFGVLAYYLVTGKKPFSGYSLDELRRQQVSQVYQVLEPVRLNAQIAPRLNWIIMKCLEKDPTQRFPSMTYLRRELERV